MKKSILSLLLLTSIFLFTSCANVNSSPENTNGLNVSVSVLPQKYFVERIGGEYVQVNVMVGPGDSPHSYEPKASQMTALSNADVYFKIGVEFEEAWMPRIASANAQMLVVDVADNINRLEMAAHDHDDEQDQEEHNEDDHDENIGNEHEIDPHVWTSPENGIKIAAMVKDTLISLDSKHTNEYQANYDALVIDIESLQKEISETLADLDYTSFLVFHPAWGYFAHEFGLEQIPIEIGGSEPSPQELAEVISMAKEEEIHVIFAQPEFSTRTVENIASEIDGRVILISPLAEDWLENLRQVVTIISEEL